MKLLVAPGATRSGFGVGQDAGLLFLLTPCCEARVGIGYQWGNCTKCGEAYADWSDKIGKNLSYSVEVGELLDPHFKNQIVEWLQKCLDDDDLTVEVK